MWYRSCPLKKICSPTFDKMNVQILPKTGVVPAGKSLTVANKLKLLLLGNNPIELGAIYDTLHTHEHSGCRFEVDVCFRANDCVRKYRKSFYDCLIIDDTIPEYQIQQVLDKINAVRLAPVPAMLLKSDNFRSFCLKGIYEFFLKKEISLTSLSCSIFRSMNFAK